MYNNMTFNKPSVNLFLSNNTDFFVVDSLRLETVKNSCNKSLNIAISNVIQQQKSYISFCADLTTDLVPNTPYHKAIDSSEQFEPEILNKFRWIASHSAPAIVDIEWLRELTKISTLSITESAIAAQSAIWKFSNGDLFNLSNDNSENVVKMYYFLLNSVGFTFQELIEHGNKMETWLFKANAIQTKNADKTIIGPYSIKGNCPNLAKFVLSGFSSPDSKIIFSKENHVKVTEISLNEDFYITFEGNINSIKFSAKASNIVFGSDVCILVANEHTSQSCCCLNPLSKDFCVNDIIRFGSLNILHKSDEHDTPLEQAEFQVENSKFDVLSYFTTDKQGTANILGLLPGTYFLKETKSPNGYVLNDKKTTVLVIEHSCETIIKSKLKRGCIKIINFDKYNNSNPVAGATFKILSKDEKIQQFVTTNEDGLAMACNLPLGEYHVCETKAPTDYYIDQNQISVSLQNSNCEIPTKKLFFCNVKI